MWCARPATIYRRGSTKSQTAIELMNSIEFSNSRQPVIACMTPLSSYRLTVRSAGDHLIACKHSVAVLKEEPHHVTSSPEMICQNVWRSENYGVCCNYVLNRIKHSVNVYGVAKKLMQRQGLDIHAVIGLS